jgi:uncharacterized membrane protein (UPF0127 family)
MGMVARPDPIRDLIQVSREYMVAQINSPVSKMPTRGPYTPEAPGDVPDIRTAPASVQPQTNITIHPSEQQLSVEVANTPALMATGVQNRDDIGVANTGPDGMLFQWSQDTQARMHSKDVSFPLSAAFFSADGMYRDHFHLQPGDAVGKKAALPHRYALEVHRDDFDSLGLAPGSRLSLADDAKSGPDQKQNPSDLTV